jgi:hypothetical protein
MPTIEDGRNAAMSGNLQQARLIFEAILQENPRSEDAWLGLADVLTEANDKRICYENALKINKSSRAAREGLRSLEPEEDPFVAALKQQTATMPTEEEEEEDLLGADETLVSARDSTTAPAVESQSETPTVVLIAVGLGLSVVVFAIVAGLVFYVLTSFMTP